MMDKPSYGQPCNNCGRCCLDQLCPLGGLMFKRRLEDGPCPALQPDGYGYTCGLVVEPQAYFPVLAFRHGIQPLSRAALYLIGSGVGCDAQVEGEADDPAFRARMVRSRDQRKLNRAMRAWGIAPDDLRRAALNVVQRWM